MAFPRFLIAGGINTGTTYVLYLCLLHIMPYQIAYTVTYAIGIGIGYFLNAKWVFKKKMSVKTASVYPLTYGVQYLLGLGMLWLFVDTFKLPKEFAPLLIVVLSVPIMYVITRTIFTSKENSSSIHN